MVITISFLSIGANLHKKNSPNKKFTKRLAAQ